MLKLSVAGDTKTVSLLSIFELDDNNKQSDRRNTSSWSSCGFKEASKNVFTASNC